MHNRCIRLPMHSQSGSTSAAVQTGWTLHLVNGHDDALRAIASESGAFLRREAVAHGFDDRAIRRMVRAGNWTRVRHGAYVPTDAWPASTVEQHVIVVRAAMRTVEGVAASHHSAAAMHGLDLWDTDLRLGHVTRIDGASGRTESGLVHHEALSLGDELPQVFGLPVMPPVRAALESASLSTVERGLVVVDSGLRAGLFTAQDLHDQHQLMSRWPGARHLQVVTRLADGRSGSVGESRARFLFWARGIPAPELQYEVYDHGRLVGITDFMWRLGSGRGLLGEFDGKVKYGRYLRPGEEPGDAVFREKRREDDLRRVTGWPMVRLTWSDLAAPERAAALVRSMLRQAA